MTEERCDIPSNLVGACELEFGHDGEQHGNGGDGFYARDLEPWHRKQQRIRTKYHALLGFFEWCHQELSYPTKDLRARCEERMRHVAAALGQLERYWPGAKLEPKREPVTEAWQILQALRSDGWMVAVHNDYRLHGFMCTFWLLTRGNQCIKGEGKDDAFALAAAQAEAQRLNQIPPPEGGEREAHHGR